MDNGEMVNKKEQRTKYKGQKKEEKKGQKRGKWTMDNGQCTMNS